MTEFIDNKLLTYKTKNEMTPTFTSGIFLSSAINILTDRQADFNATMIITIILMFVSSLLFFIEAAKTHELQAWFFALAPDQRTDDNFLTGPVCWDLNNSKDFYKPILAFSSLVAWILGILSLILFIFV